MDDHSTRRLYPNGRSRWRAGVLATAGLLGLASIAAQAPANAAGEAVTITLTALSSARPGVDPVIAEFEASQDAISVEATYYEPGDAYAAAVPTQFAGGNGSDIVMVLGGHASPYSTTSFAAAGYLLDLTNESWVDTMYAPTRALYEVDGAVYARDLGIAPLAVTNYNKAFFAEHDLDVPSTFDEMLELCLAIAETGTTPIAWGAGNPAVNANNVATFAARTVLTADPDWLATRLDGDTTFVDTPGWRRALEQLEELIDGGCFSPGAGGMALTDMISEFANTQSAMMYTYGGLNGQVLEQTPDMDIGMFPMPADDPDDTRVQVQASGGFGIWSESQHVDAAREFLEYISDPEVSAVFTEAAQLLSPAQATAGELPGIYADLDAWFADDQVLADITALWPNPQMNTLTGQSIQGLFTGQKTVDDVLADMDTYFDQE